MVLSYTMGSVGFVFVFRVDLTGCGILCDGASIHQGKSNDCFLIPEHEKSAGSAEPAQK